MAMYFEVKVKYEKTNENGMTKRVSEKFLCDALSCTEAETIATERLQPFVSGDSFTASVKQTAISEFVGTTDAERYYLAKVGFILLMRNLEWKSESSRRFLLVLIILSKL